MKVYDKLVKWFLVDESKLPNLDWLSSSEHFIPIYFSDILSHALGDNNLDEQEREHLRTLADMFAEHYHLDYHRDALDMKEAFSPFDPDAEVEWRPEYTEEDRNTRSKNFATGIQVFLKACNFCELEKKYLDIVLKAPYPGILPIKVDYRKLDSIKIYYRGAVDYENKANALFVLRKSYPSKKMKRVFVLARYKKEYDHKIIAKVFRDVPIENLKVVIPEVRLSLPIFDQIKVGGTGLISISMALSKVFLAAVLTPVLFVMLLVGVISGFMKALFGFINSRTKCLKTYSESLYHKSLASNMGAINLLVEQAETQEVKEAFLAYYILYILRNENLTEAQLDNCVEAWLQEHFGFYIDFEVEDALRKLIEKNIVTKFTPTGSSAPIYKVYDLPSALRRLDEMWDNYHINNNEGDAFNDAIAGMDALSHIDSVPIMRNRHGVRTLAKNQYRRNNRNNSRINVPKHSLITKSCKGGRILGRKFK